MIPAGILAKASSLIASATLAVYSAGASADVMELDAEGARWVAGGNSIQMGAAGELANGQLAGVVTTDAAGVLQTKVTVPLNAVSNTTSPIRGVPLRYVAKVQELSQRYDLSPSLIEALVWQESRWRENAVSHAGARGLAQLMPGTAKYLGVNPDDPMQNLEGGARYLREQYDTFGSWRLALAAYNAGPGAVQQYGGVPPYRETENYVRVIWGS